MLINIRGDMASCESTCDGGLCCHLNRFGSAVGLLVRETGQIGRKHSLLTDRCVSLAEWGLMHFEMGLRVEQPLSSHFELHMCGCELQIR